MKTETKERLAGILTLYLESKRSLRDCAEWIAGADWNALVLDPEREELTGRTELLLTELSEGLRPEGEVRKEIASIINLLNSLDMQPNPETTRVVSSSTDRWFFSPVIFEISSPLQMASSVRYECISPQPVSS